MLRKLAKSAFLALGLTVAQHAGAFTLWGPVEAWQTTDLDYSSPAGSTRYYYFFVEPSLDGIENGAPKNFGEGSRLTTPIVTYGFDDTFLNYFGAQGVAAVDSAMKLLNALPSSSKANLDNFLTEGAVQVNYTAQALELYDLKSEVLSLMAEHMGLMGETHVFDLGARGKIPGTTPICDYEYFVLNRNYDPVTFNPTAYVNGRLIYYEIWDGCGAGVNVGDAVEYPADSTSTPRYTAIATPSLQQYGGYYLNFTRDDMGGLKYLYRANNYVFQGVDSNSVVEPFATTTWQAVGTNAITGISNFVGVLGGVEKITFVKVNYDSLLGTEFTPISYSYKIPYVTNSRLSQLSVTRTITAPDILFTAAYMISNGPPITDFELARSGTFIATTYVSPGGGVIPSTIDPQETIVLNNAGPVYYNYNPTFLDSLNYFDYPVFNWGTFDGSTNPPIVYPTGSSLEELEAQVLEGGQSVVASPWNPVNLINTNTTTTTGTGGGGG